MQPSEQEQEDERLGGDVLAELVEHASVLMTAAEVLTSLNGAEPPRWSADDVDLGVQWLARRGLVRREGGSLVMTVAGAGMFTLMRANKRVAG